MIVQTIITTDNVVESHHETGFVQKIPHRTNTSLHHEIEITMTEVLLLNITHPHDMITINEVPDRIVLLIDHISSYTSSFRPSSRPRDSRYSRSRSHSYTRNKLNTVQTQSQNDPIKFEVQMYHPSEVANGLTPTSWFYALYSHTSEKHNRSDQSSRLEISFLLDSVVLLFLYLIF